jgi:diguanylate cyclase (GGDEF)-like protein
MQVFISWSGKVSRAVANELSKWLEHVLPNIYTFVSTQDIDAGDRWEAIISEELNSSHHAVLCVTRDNQTAPWLLYEAGALGKLVSRAKVIPYTIGFSPQELAIGPLSRFQGVQNDKAGTWQLVRSLNRSQPTPKEEGFVREAFDLWWPRLEGSMRESRTIQPLEKNENSPSDREVLLQLREDMNHVLRYIRQRELTDVLRQRDLEFFNRDSLTSLANRRAFAARGAELEASKSSYVIALLDLDNFKTINDLYGHAEGDRVLSVVGASLSEVIRQGDLAARYGGEAFGVLFVGVSVETASEIIQRFINELPELLKRKGAPPITASVGLNSDKAESFNAKFQEADVALYEAKSQGKNRVIIHH